MNRLLSIVMYSYKGGVKKTSFIVTTIIGILLSGLLINIPAIIANLDKGKDGKIVVMDKTGTLINNTDGFEKFVSAKYDWAIEKPDREADIRNEIMDDKLKGAVIIEKDRDLPISINYVVKRMNNPDMLDPLNAYIQSLYSYNTLKSLNLSQDEYARLTAKIPLEVKELGKSTKNTFFPVYIMLGLLYMCILTYGSIITTMVAAEKSSRVMELLITTVRPVWLLLGKVLGFGLVGLTQFLLLMLSGFAFYQLGPKSGMKLGDFNFNFASMPPSTYIYLIIFFLLGYFLFASLHAAAGSLVSRTEDATSTMMSLMIVIMFAFMGSMYSLTNPDSTFTFVCSFIPFTSPMIMFLRVTTTEVPFYQVLISIIILIVSIGIVTWISAKIYRTGVLLYGKTPGFKDIVRAVADYKA